MCLTQGYKCLTQGYKAVPPLESSSLSLSNLNDYDDDDEGEDEGDYLKKFICYIYDNSYV